MTDEPQTQTATGDEAKKERIFAAAEPLFQRFGYRKTTVEDVCKAAGISKRTFYELFSGKPKLFGGLLVHISEVVTDQWEDRLNVGSPRQRLETFLDMYVAMIEEHPVWHLFYEMGDSWDVANQVMRDLAELRVVQVFHRILSDGIEDGSFRDIQPENGVLITFSLLDSLYIVLPSLLGLPGASENEGLALQAREFIIHGMLQCGSDRQGEHCSGGTQ